ncbi:MAG: hypothetical protein JO043_05965, partial [Candidatus Eremiobacteraeota bacterium]|nr:hypothetical protein [Candidatus Eremiobacteraeota bacterium]
MGPKLFDRLKMLRKKHAGVILVAPSVTDLLNSDARRRRRLVQDEDLHA